MIERLVAYFDGETEAPSTVRGTSRSAVALAAHRGGAAAGLAALSWIDCAQPHRHDAGGARAAAARDRVRCARSPLHRAAGAGSAARSARPRIAQLEGRLAESQSQQLALEALYQELSRNRDEWQLAEIEQVLAIASQQLQLARNVRAALLALQLADSRLARTDRPQFAPIRRALARDIERLKAAPAVDFAAVTAAHRQPDRRRRRACRSPSTSAPSARRPRRTGGAPSAASWSRLGAEVWSEISQLVVVRRMDAPEPPLLPPSQAYFVRENLRLRLLNARASLLTRDEAGYREDLRAAGVGAALFRRALASRPPTRSRSSSSSLGARSASRCRRSPRASTRCAATSRAANARPG